LFIRVSCLRQAIVHLNDIKKHPRRLKYSCPQSATPASAKSKLMIAVAAKNPIEETRMSKTQQAPARQGCAPRPLALAACIAAAFIPFHAAWAFQIDTGNPDVQAAWDTTIKYSTAVRVKSPSTALLAEPFPGFANTDDGDRNFKRGLISNRLDLLSEFDVSYKGWGMRMSGAAWYDSVYNRANDNDSPSTANQISAPYNEFTSATRSLHGHKAELLDAFVFGNAELGGAKATFRAGKHTLLWGESLFFGANGIANGQGSIDVAKAMSVPNTQFKELMRPVQQVSGQLQLTSDVSIGAYYQFRWEKLRLPAVGSYFSAVDIVPEEGSERLFVPAFPGSAFFHGDDMKAKDSGQGGLQARFRIGDVDYGVYAIRYHDKAPQIYLRPGAGFNPAIGQLGQYVLVYPEGISSYGASATTTVGNVNFASEVSIRRNTPLASDPQVDPVGAGNNSSNPLYAVGNSAHAQLSWIASLGPNFISQEADFVGEIAWNRVTSTTRNESALNPNASRDATNIRVVYEPKYRQVMPGLDLSVPVGVGYGLSGNSAVVGSFYGKGVGDLSIGLSGAYLDVWRFGVNYTHFFGPEGTFLDSAGGHVSYKQSLKDRDFVSLTVYRTF
jgi:hypothetical protein